MTPLLDAPGLAAVLDALPGARIVGGAVRDALIGRPVADIDLATPEPPAAVTERLARAGLRALPTGLAHGTVTALSDGRAFEITTLRRDVETDGRHATVAWTDDWREDAARRDFTFNAMSLDRGGALHDYFDGAADARAGRVRFVGDPARRIEEDYLRVLRFFRFFARYGAEAPEDATRAALAGGAPRLATLSAERVWAELKRILAAPDPRPALTLMRALGVLGAVLPEAGAPDRLGRVLAAGPDPLLRLAALAPGADAGRLAMRLKLANAERDRFASLLAGPVPRMADDDAELRRQLADTPAPLLLDRAWLAGEGPGLAPRLADAVRPVFPLAGRDAVDLGVAPGPQVGAALAAVRAWWREGGCVAGREACLAELARILGAHHDRRVTG